MKKRFSPRLCPWFALLCGLCGLAFNFWLQRTGFDEKGLLSRSHPAIPALFLLCAIALGGLLVLTWHLRGKKAPFPSSVSAAIGCFLAAAGTVFAAIQELRQPVELITLLCAGSAFLAAACLILTGICRFKGWTPSFWLYTLITVYCMLHLVCQYRSWSAEPQLVLYFFPLLCSIFLMLTAYQSACLAARQGSCRWYTFCRMGALCFSCISICTGSWSFYLGMALWTALGLPSGIRED